MSEWKRSTREVTFEQLPPDVQAEIRKHIERYNLGDILSATSMSVQTDSEKAKKGLFGSAEVVHQVALLTPRWLIWIASGTKTPVSAHSALLQDVVVQDYAKTPFVKMIPDSGIEVSGKFTDTSENASAFVGLEDNAAGEKFKTLVIESVQGVKK